MNQNKLAQKKVAMNSTATYDHSNSHDWVYDFVSVMNTPVVLDPLDSSQTLGSPEILSELEGDQAYLTTPQADGEAPVQKKRKSGGTFQCLEETCGKTFTQQAHLSIHMRKHTGITLISHRRKTLRLQQLF